MRIEIPSIILGGYKEEAVMETWHFHDQFHTFHSQVWMTLFMACIIYSYFHSTRPDPYQTKLTSSPLPPPPPL